MTKPKQKNRTAASSEKRPKRRSARKFGEWTMPDAAARFEEVVRKTRQGPQVLSNESGVPLFVVVSIADWQDMNK